VRWRALRLGASWAHARAPADVKSLALVDQFLELKKSGKLEQHLAKRRKKNATKDRRYIPSERRASQ
jgi:hypothetical protein